MPLSHYQPVRRMCPSWSCTLQLTLSLKNLARKPSGSSDLWSKSCPFSLLGPRSGTLQGVSPQPHISRLALLYVHQVNWLKFGSVTRRHWEGQPLPVKSVVGCPTTQTARLKGVTAVLSLPGHLTLDPATSNMMLSSPLKPQQVEGLWIQNLFLIFYLFKKNYLKCEQPNRKKNE